MTKYCISCNKIRNRKYYLKNRDKIIKRILKNEKENNYIHQKTEKQRKLRYIKRETRRKYPLKEQKCILCKNKATEHHHPTKPIQISSFVFTCHGCHITHEEELNREYERLPLIWNSNVRRYK